MKHQQKKAPSRGPCVAHRPDKKAPVCPRCQQGWRPGANNRLYCGCTKTPPITMKEIR